MRSVAVLVVLATIFSVFTLSKSTAIKCTGPHEYPDCGSACQTTCKNLGKPCPIVNIRCNDACYCRDGYARNDQNVCIPIKNCPPKPCY